MHVNSPILKKIDLPRGLLAGAPEFDLGSDPGSQIDPRAPRSFLETTQKLLKRLRSSWIDPDLGSPGNKF
eukprot:SAG11_NODE_20319_length_448_cov_0.739255_2_plen_69_part_01